MRRARKSINQINVVPYIDVMLVLLVIFMVTAPLINPGAIELPSVGSKLTVPAAPMEVTLRSRRDADARGQAGGDCGGQGIARRARRRASSAKQARVPDQPVVICAAARRAYEDVIGVLDLLQTNGAQKVGLLARPHRQLR